MPAKYPISGTHYVNLRRFVLELLQRSDSGFRFVIQLHRALFVIEMTHYCETGRPFVTAIGQQAVTFERQNSPDGAHPVCVQLPDALDRMEARGEVAIHTEPLFGLGGFSHPERCILRRQRYVIQGVIEPLKLNEGQSALFDAAIDWIAHGRHNELAMLPWERVIATTTYGRRIERGAAMLLRPFVPVRAFERRLAKEISRGDSSES